jgi:hypothetical protein
MAQLYYDQAIKEPGAEKVPIYLMSLYNSWQSLKVEDMLTSFSQQTTEQSWSRGSLVILS